MAHYNVVKLSYGANEHTFYGKQDEHNHGRNGEFLQAAIGLMVTQYGCAKEDVRGSDNLRINQNKPGNGNELKWSNRSRKWEQA
jgi:hypothetical protein